MQILVVNSGSSSIKFSLFRAGEVVYDGELSGIGAHARLEITGTDARTVKAESAVEAIGVVMDAVSAPGQPEVEAVGYRVVHPGSKLQNHQRITDEVLHDLEEAAVFAPLHDPEAVQVIREGMKRFPGVGHFACFDTVFHCTMPEEATVYPLPEEYRERGVRRYGFHGLSCESIVQQLRKRDGAFPQRLAIAHLGSGCSVTAVLNGRSVDTSMGLTPTGGVVMGTRPGDLDPGLMLYLLRQQTGSNEDAVAAVEKMLNHSAGMVALSGMNNDVKAVREASAKGDARATLALKVFTRSVTKAIGSFCWLLGGLDAVVFAGGIGEHDALTRAEVLHGLDGLGIAIDPTRNELKSKNMREVGASHARTAVLVVPAQEDLMIAQHVEHMARSEK